MTTRYIDPSGNNSTGDGTIGSPWYDLFYAIDNSSSTDTIIVNEGTYLATIGAVFTSISDRTIISENDKASETIIDFINVNFDRVGSSVNGNISGITFKSIRPSASNKASFDKFIGTIIRKCIFDDCASGSAVRGRGGLFSECNTKLSNCLFKNCFNEFGTESGIITSSGDADFNTDIENCTVFFDGSLVTTGFFMPSAFIYYGDGGDDVVRTANVKNTIVSIINSSANFNFSITTGTNSSSTVEYSCLHNTDYDGSDTGVITLDPKFIDPANGFFELKPSSPCIGTGTIA